MRTYTVTETLPDGRARTLATGLRLPEAQKIYRTITWAGTIVQEPAQR